jgi:hypothetical protein
MTRKTCKEKEWKTLIIQIHRIFPMNQGVLRVLLVQHMVSTTFWRYGKPLDKGKHQAFGL